MTALATYFLLALCVSFLCSLMEAVLLTTSRAHIAVQIKKGRASGRILKGFKARIDTPLSAILTLNTIANTLGAAGVGAQSLKLFGSEWVALASIALTFSILIFSEIIPKTLGTLYWRPLSHPAAYIITIMIFITYPLVFLTRGISQLLTRKHKPIHLTREDLLALAQIGESEGILMEGEARIIENLFKLKKLQASDVLTPRSVLQAFHKDLTVGEIVARYNPIRFSKIPVYDRDIDHVTGMVYRSKIIDNYLAGKTEATMDSLSTPLHVIPLTRPLATVLEDFIKRKEHIFLVVDEYGGTEGIITLEDIIETLLGAEIVDELDTEEDMRKLARRLWQDRMKRHYPDRELPPR